MKKKYFQLIVIMLLMLAAATVLANSPKMLVRVYVESKGQAEVLAQQPFDFASRYIAGYADIVADANDLDRLTQLGLKYELLQSSSAGLSKSSAWFLEGGYHTYESMADKLHAIAAKYPNIVYVTSIGKSVEGRDIWAIKISDNPVTDEADEPCILYNGNIHAREIITPEVILYFIDHVVENYGKQPEITDIVDNRQLWLVPILNPDGHVQVEGGNVWWRKNRRINSDGKIGVDLNRNFGFMWGCDNIGSSPYTYSETYRGSSAFSEPETQALRDLVKEQHFIAAVNYHSYGRFWLYPWSHKRENTIHHRIYTELSKQLTRDNGYLAGNTNEGVIYLVNGDADDYLYGEQTEKNMIFSFTPEVGTTFFPAVSEIPQLVQENLSANIYIARIAGILDEDPWLIFPPSVPVVSRSAINPDDGYFELSWKGETGGSNPAKYFEVEALQDFGEMTDDAEHELVVWKMDHFIRTEEMSSSGSYSYYSTTGRNTQASMTTIYQTLIQPDQVLSFKLWYDLRTHWDYAYVEISTDNGATFETLEGNVTTPMNPYGLSRGHAITGSSKGKWVDAVFYLSNYVGKQATIRVVCDIKSYYYGRGIFVDDIGPVTKVGTSELVAQIDNDTRHELRLTHPGDYIYRVRAVDADDQASDWSELQFVNVDFGIRGDVNANQMIEDNDVARAVQIVLDNSESTTGERYRADIDSSASVDITDVIRLIQMAKVFGAATTNSD